MKITSLLPERVFFWFGEICKIPHGSGNTQILSQYITDFAQNMKLEYKKDAVGNIAIYKNGTNGYENHPRVILQGHIDMVCTKADGVKKDMEKEGIEVLSDGEYIWANGTTLGADDGIGVAYMLSILEAKDIPHPPITALFTVDEETGMTGAAEIDPDILRGTRLINIDSEEEGIFTVSCAGGVRVICEIPVDYIDTADEMKALSVEVYGLKGGHSGVDIGKNRYNGIKIMGRLLKAIPYEFGIMEVITGDKLNVIPQGATVKICIPPTLKEKTRDAIIAQAREISNEIAEFEPDFGVKVTSTAKGEEAVSSASSRLISEVLCEFPDGVEKRREDSVLSSLNMGMAELVEVLRIGTMLRANVEAEKQNMTEKIRKVIYNVNGKVICEADYPSWEYKEASPLRDTMVSVYHKMFGNEPRIESIHAGLECGLFAARIPELDMVSIGPDLEGVHTPLERMNVASARRCWEYLVTLLGEL